MNEELTFPNIDNIPEIRTTPLPDAPPCPLCGRHPEHLESGHCACCKIVVDDIDAWNALPRDLTWTTEPPKTVGKYWWRWDPCSPHRIYNVRIMSTIHTLLVAYSTTSYAAEPVEDIGGQWAGPIPEPREPKEQGGYDG